MVDQLVAAAALGVLFLAAVYAHHQRVEGSREPFWRLAAGATAALVVVYAVGEAHLAPQPVLGVVSFSGGVMLLAALAIPFAILVFDAARSTEA